MATWWNQVLVHYVDAAGRDATTFWSLADQSSAVPAGLSALADALQACSRAHVKTVQLQTSLHRGGSASESDYKTVQDVVHMVGRYGTNRAHYDLIAPKSTILLADNATLDLLNPDVVALVGAMVAVLGTPAGVPLTSITKGVRQYAGRR